MRLRLTRAEWCAVAFALLVAHGFLAHELLYPSSGDAGRYAALGRAIADHGLLHRFAPGGGRTYGYPFVLSLVHRAATVLGSSFTVLLFVLQLSLYLAAALLLRAALSRTWALAARIAWCGLLVNYYVLVYTPQSLTESISISLLVASAACWLRAYRPGAGVWPLIAGSLVIGFAVMVRPANAFMVVAWVAGAVIIGIRRRPSAQRAAVTAACLIFALVAPSLPQLANNVRHFGRWTPLVVLDLGTLQQIWGIQSIKYATAVPPVPVERIHYDNPFVSGTTVEQTTPWRWYLAHPARGVMTVALHTFNLTDQDLLFTYSRDLDPWYRLPLGFINHIAVALGLLGFVLLARRVQAARETHPSDALLVLLLLIAANWVVYAGTAVEMRFGSVLLLILFPLAGHALIRLAAARPVARVVALLGVATYAALALLLSGWVRAQAAPIRDLQRLSPESSIQLTGGGLNQPSGGRVTGWVVGTGFRPGDSVSIDGKVSPATFGGPGLLTFVVEADRFAGRTEVRVGVSRGVRVSGGPIAVVVP